MKGRSHVFLGEAGAFKISTYRRDVCMAQLRMQILSRQPEDDEGMNI